MWGILLKYIHPFNVWKPSAELGSPTEVHRWTSLLGFLRRGLMCEAVFAVELGTDMRRRSSGREEDEEELLRRRQLQEEQLMKVCP